MPYSPMNAATNMIKKRRTRIERAILKAGVAKLEIPVKETTITITGEIIPACTAACPNTKPPIMDTVWPIGDGIRMPASRIISNVISIMRASTKAGKGTPSLCEARLINNEVGIIS